MGTPDATQLDPRGLRFAATITAVVLVLALISPSPGRELLLAFQTVVFATAAAFGVGRSLYATIFRTVVRPRLGPPSSTEDSRPPRFAQLVGLVFTGGALIAFLAGAPTVGLILTGFAFVAAALNATVGLCLGCEIYLTWHRIVGHRLT